MSKRSTNYPFQPLGKQLKQLRVKRQESLAEVSGAVEIEPEALGAMEDGVQRPSEDILFLLINHFAAKDEVANKLWELAGYRQDAQPEEHDTSGNKKHTQHNVVAMPGDLRIVYTDMVHVMVNDFGLVMNFMQTAGLGGHPLAIARVGMSREHAQSVLDILQKTLAMHPKTLPEGKTPPKTPESSK
ncbi:MAG: helix-turn-helix transcriptional regulator [Patescibacteria group bacterium]